MSKIIYFLVSLLILTLTGEYSSMLTKHCEVHKTENNTIVCTGRNLTSIPVDELNQLNASSVQILDISNNNLKLSSDDVASLQNYSNYLKHSNRFTLLILLVNKNDIENLPNLSGVLPNLIEINLQCNNITYLRARQFFGYQKLRTVCLDHNPLNDTVLENLKAKLPQIDFKCRGSNNSLGEEARKCVEDDVTASNTKKESAKITKSTNSTSEETPTTKSDSFLSTTSSTREESATTKSMNSTSEETPATKSDSLSTTPANRISKENYNIRLIFCIVLGVGVFLCFISFIIYQKRKEPKKKLEETENQENLASGELKLLDRGLHNQSGISD